MHKARVLGVEFELLPTKKERILASHRIEKEEFELLSDNRKNCSLTIITFQNSDGKNKLANFLGQ